MGQSTDTVLLFNDQVIPELSTPYVDEESTWAHAHTSDSGYDYFHPLPNTSAPAYPTLTSSPEYNFAGFSSGSEPSASYAPSTSSISSTSSAYYSPTTLSVPLGGSSQVQNLSGQSRPVMSRSPSPNTSDLYNYGTLNTDSRTWKCAYPGCHSKAIFVRPCDLRKHFHRHNKNFFCRHEGCPQAREGGFSSKKDRARHESKHNPGVPCEWEGCERIFSRVDNMRNHMQRSR